MSDPIFNEFYFIPKPEPGPGATAAQDTADQVEAQGIVIAMGNNALEGGQTWERLDG